MRIKMINLSEEYLNAENDILPAITEVLKNGCYIQGSVVREFEFNLAEYLGVKHVISCGNGTDALQIALMALDISTGDEVIIPAFSYIAVAEVICLLGATPVFADVDETYFQFDIDSVKKAISAKTKAIVPVHLFGQTANLESILEIAKQNNIKIIEDCAQSMGGKYKIDNTLKSLGSFGDMGCTSFFPTKNLACFGDGGAIYTNNDELAAKARMIANHGQKEKYNHHLIGVNSRLDSLQAAVLNVKLKTLNSVMQKKALLANRYNDQLGHLEALKLPKTHPNSENSWNIFTIKIKDGCRDRLKNHLSDRGIDSMIYYPKPIMQQPAYQKYAGDFPVAAKLCASVLSIPIHQLLTLQDIDYICTQIIDFFDAEP